MSRGHDLEARCWCCNELTDDATVIDVVESTPRAGDVSICLYCGAPGLFTGVGYRTREPNTLERIALLNDPTVIAARAWIALENPGASR